jgi:hypothetical protein
MLDYDMADDFDFDESFEGLDNVRACCDGKHLVGDSHHHHGKGKDKERAAPIDFAPPTPLASSLRTQTPTNNAPSIRSRASSILSTVRRGRD